jgi:hypothetical protein
LLFAPKGKNVVLGLVTSKSGTLESKDYLKVRISKAAKLVDVGQLCLSSRCGFSCTKKGDDLTLDQQWLKLAPIVSGRRRLRPGEFDFLYQPRKRSCARSNSSKSIAEPMEARRHR